MNDFERRRLPLCPEQRPRQSVYLLPGDYHFATRPTLIHTVLGSCISVVLFDPQTRYGAMCHAVLNRAEENAASSVCMKYVDCAIHRMIRDFTRHTIPTSRLKVKLFGGAVMLSGGYDHRYYTLQPGVKNLETAKSVLRGLQCQIVAEDSGGTVGRKIYFCSHTGDVFLKRLNRIKPHRVPEK